MRIRSVLTFGPPSGGQIAMTKLSLLAMMGTFIGLSVTMTCFGQNAGASAVADLLGDWSGESICVNKDKFPACKDEVVLYHVTSKEGKADTVHITMDKIVNGAAEFMAEGDFVCDAPKHLLTSEFRNERVHLRIEFTVASNVAEGTVVSLPDKTTVRRIKLKKVDKKPEKD